MGVLAISDAVAVSLGTALIALIGTIVFPGIMAYMFARLRQDQADRSKEAAVKVEEVKTAAAAAAVKVEEVKQDLAVRTNATDKRLDGLAIVGNASHAFANARYGLLLDRLRRSDQRLADITNLVEDRQRAAASEMDYQSHVAAQVVVDAQPGTGEQKKGMP